MRPLDPRLRPFLAPATAPLVAVLGAGVLGGALVVGQAIALGSFLVALVSDPAGSAWHEPAWWLAGVVVARALTSYVGDRAAATATARVSADLRRRVVSAGLADTPLPATRVGDLAVLATRGTQAIEPYLTRYLPAVALAAVLPALTVGTILALDWPSGLIVLLTLPLVPLFAVLVGLATRDRANRQWRALTALAGHFLDVVRGLPTLVVHGRAGAQTATIRSITDRYRRASLDTLRLAFASSAVLELVATLSVALVAVSVGLRLAAGSLDFRTAMIVLLLAPEAYWPLRRVGAEFHSAAEGTAAFEAVAALPSTESHRGTRRPTDGPIHLDGLTIRYPARDRDALGPVDAELEPGLTAVVGPSGCGKSTLLATLAGELAPAGGRVSIGGTDLRDLDPESWRSRVAWAPQRPWLTPASVAENVRHGRPDATDAEVWAALERVGLGADIAALPAGVHTPLGEDGAGLSAGQRARLALARVLLADRPVVLLDEPTAHLDAETEQVLLDTMRWLAARSTVVVVAHRDAVVRIADRVLRLPAPVPAEPVRQPAPALARAARPVASRISPAPETAEPGRWHRLGGTALGTLSVASGVALTATAAWLITRASTHPPVLVLMVAIVGVRTFGIARPVLRYAERLVSHDAALRLLGQRRAAVYDALVPLVPGALGRRRGDLLAAVVDDVDALVDRELRVRQPLWTGALVASGAALFAALVSPIAGLVVVCVAFVALLAGATARWGAAAAEREYVAARAALVTTVEETLHGARHLVAWQRGPAALARLAADGHRVDRATVTASRRTAAARATVLAACGLGVVAVGLLVPPSSTDGAMLALLTLLPLALADALLPVPDAAVLSVRTRAALARVDHLAEIPPRVADPDHAAVLAEGLPHLALADVAAGWDERPAFRGLDLDLPAGRRLGVAGPSGCGKSTLAAVLVRFLDPQTGTARLSGTDLRDLTLADVRRAVGLVDDDPYVFASSVLENVRLARPTASDDEVLAALGRVRLGGWLAGLPDGADTLVGDGHADVSGGERARIGLARAVLADRPVLVLDEPTAHLDTETATALADDLLAGPPSRAVVWITHGRLGLDRMDAVLDLGAAGAVVQTPTGARRPVSA